MHRLTTGVQYLLAGLTLCFALLLAAGQIQLFWQFHPHMPFRDTWRILPLVQQVLVQGWTSTGMDDWFALHAGAHRVALTRLLMALDYQWLRGQNHLLFASAWLAIGWLWFFYSGLFRRLGHRGPTLVFYSAVCALFLLAPGQFFNLINPIGGSWYLALAFSGAAIWLALRGGYRCLIASCLLAALAGLSNFSGALVFLVQPLAVLIRRGSRAEILLTLIRAVVYLGLYQRGIQSGIGLIAVGQGLGVGALTLQLLFDILDASLVFLSSPLHAVAPMLAYPLSAVSLLFLAYALFDYLRRVTYSPEPACFTLVACLCAGIALATALGRPSTGAIRYQSVAMLYWLSIAGLAASRLSSRSSQVLCCVLLFMTLGLPLFNRVDKGAYFLNALSRGEVLARLDFALSGEFPRAIMPWKGVTPDQLAVHVDFLHDRQLAFAAPEHRTWPLARGLFTRGLELRCDDKLLGELRPQLVLPFQLRHVLPGGDRRWEGYLATSDGEPVSLSSRERRPDWRCPER